MNYDVKVYSSEEDVKKNRMTVDITVAHGQSYPAHLIEEMVQESIGGWISTENYDKLLRKYPYIHLINFHAGLGKIKKIYAWFSEMEINYVHFNRTFFFKTEEDRLLFLMVWA